jgi:hypothetical protein
MAIVFMLRLDVMSRTGLLPGNLQDVLFRHKNLM